MSGRPRAVGKEDKLDLGVIIEFMTPKARDRRPNPASPDQLSDHH